MTAVPGLAPTGPRRRLGRFQRLLFRSYGAAKLYHRATFAWEGRRDVDPILVYQMGKVGSSAVTRSLRESAVSARIYKPHFLTREALEGEEKRYRDGWKGGRRALHVWEGQYLYDKVRASREEPWRIVTLVREPVARNVSAFFQTLDQDRTAAREDVDALAHAFADFEGHDEPLRWFDCELEPVFGVDVFARPFPQSRGYDVFRNERARVLVVRLEDLKRVAGEAFGEFLGLDGFAIRETNVASDKDYSRAYSAFVSSVRLPAAYLDEMYGSRYTRHFYSKEEIEAFRSRWQEGDGG